MRHITRHTNYESRSDVFSLLSLGDIHLGNRHADERLLRELVLRIEKEPHTFWIGLGDYCEWIRRNDPRFDTEELADWLFDRQSLADIARAELRYFLRIVEPVKHKCVGIVRGNHGWTILQHSEVDVYSSIVEALANNGFAHRLDHRGVLSWKFQRLEKSSTWTLRIAATHGSGGGTSKGNAANKLGKQAEQFDGVDVILMGHLHAPCYLPLNKWRPGRTKEVEHVTVHAVSIPPLCGDMQYANEKDLAAACVGFAELIIVPDKRRVSVKITTV